MLSKIKSFGWGYVILGAILCAIGVCFLAFNNTYTVLAIVIGILTAVCGIGVFVAAMIKKERGIAFALKMVVAICCLVSGTVTAITQSQSIIIIANIFFLLLLIDGAFKLQLSIVSARFSFFGWWIMLVSAMALIVCAFLMAKFTPTDEVQLSVLTGLLLLLDGITNILSSFWNTAALRVTSPKEKASEKAEKKDEKSSEEKKTDEQPLFFAPDEDAE